MLGTRDRCVRRITSDPGGGARWMWLTNVRPPALATFAFTGSSEHELNLAVGEEVWIVAQCGEWFQGVSAASQRRGIFPVSYVSILADGDSGSAVLAEEGACPKLQHATALGMGGGRTDTRARGQTCWCCAMRTRV